MKKLSIEGSNYLMQLEVNKTYHGFKLLRQEEVKELNSTAMLFEHTKSGARLFNLKNDDDNKVFSISFRTPPKDSTGLPHILEHSVLCGSRKFPLKDPFVELVKGSLNTFLNAMTFSDKTMYPVASRNDKDFLNLMDVYLDAVFYPNIYKYPEIFMQEGWHYELENKDDSINYKGVVYNEMKGAFSSPESVLSRKIQETLFPDTPYGKESGGDPDVIPRLSLEEFLAFHKKYYHPSNSYIFLYGNGDIIEYLKFIDGEYLEAFDRLAVDSRIPVQSSFSSLKEIVEEYPISEDEDESGKAFLSLNFAMGRSTDRELYLAFEVLEHLLLETPAAPLKKALIDAEIGKDVMGKFDNSILQPVFSVIVKNSDVSKKDRMKGVVFDTLRKLVKDGIDKELIEASVNVKEFDLREADFRGFPKGLLYNIKAMDSWLYDEDPVMHLEFEPALAKVKTAMDSRYFEDLIEKYILNNNHSTMLILKPSKGFAEASAREVREELARFKAGLDDEEIEKIIKDTVSLKKRQNESDSAEDMRTIPLLELKDIKKEAEELPIVEKKENGVKVLSHPLFTNGIAYLNLLFDTTSVRQEMIPYIGLLAEVIGKIDTEKYSYGSLANQINIHTGGIRLRSEVYTEKGNDSLYYPKITVRSKALIDRMPKLTELIGEMVGHSKFEDKKRLKEIIMEVKSRIEMAISDRGHAVAYRRLYSYFSPTGKYTEILTGLDFYKFIAGLEKHFDSMAGEIIKNLNEVSSSIFNKSNLLVSITASEEDYGKFKDNFDTILNSIGDERAEKQEYKFNLSPDNEGMLTPGKIQYVAKGYNFIKLGHKYSGSLQVLETIGGYDYLWNNVRVQGGAYGVFISFDRNGNMYMVSYRDPNLKETLSVYDGMGDYLRKFDVDEREMTKYIIGTMSKVDFPLTPPMKGDKATENYISHVTFEDIQRERDEVLNTKNSDIRNFAAMLNDVMKQDNLCAIGSEGKLKENKDIFKKLITVFE
jgi:Predicted Zn-dependent peptidases, insulinase-like